MTAIIKYIIAGIALVAITSSCTKSWLDVSSTGQIRSEDQFKTEDGFKDALMGVYIGMTHPSLYGMNMTWGAVDIMSRQYNPFIESATYADVQSFRYKARRGMAQVDSLWNLSYTVIGNVNNALNEIDKNKSVLHAIDYSIIKGELLGLRAFLHFNLLRLYGYGNMANRPEVAGKMALPYVTQFAKEITPQRSYTQTFAVLQKDITDALELLKEDPIYKVIARPANYYEIVNRNGFYNKREQRMNFYAVKALQARVLIWMGGTANLTSAKAAAEEVIAASPARLITPATSPASDRIFYSEHLFNLNISAFMNVVNRFFPAQVTADNNSFFLLKTNADALYETQTANIGIADKRYNTLLESNTVGMVPVKLYQRAGGVMNAMPLMKLPEMYYIAAEEYLESNLSKAIEYLNIVRKSRGIIQDIPANAPKATVADELMKEYRKEFISEGQLFFYYKRLGKTTFPGLPTSVTADDKVYVVPYPDNEIEFGNRVQ